MLAPLLRTASLSTADKLLPPCWVSAGGSSIELSGGGLLYPGEALDSLPRTLIAMIEGAREVVMVASFLLADEQLAAAMLAASDRGVRVYALTASEHRVSAGLREDEEESRQADDHRRLLARLAGRVVVRTAEHLHAKFVVVDPLTTPRGVVSTANFNRALWDSVELGVEVSATVAQALAQLFSWVFWKEASRELVDGNKLLSVATPPAEPRYDGAPGLHTTRRGDRGLGDECLRMVEGATKVIRLAAFTLDPDHPITSLLIAKKKAGLDVAVFVRPRTANRVAVERLEANGVVVYGHPKLHAKAIYTDRDALIMTANVAPHGLESGFEVGVALDVTQRARLRATFEAWATGNGFQRFKTDVRCSDVLGEVLTGADGGGRIQVLARKAHVLPRVEARSALDLDDAPEPKLVPPDVFAHHIDFSWEVHAPRLPAKAREILRDGDLTQRKHGKVVPQQVPHVPRRYESMGPPRETLLLYDASMDQGELRRLANELGARVVVA